MKRIILMILLATALPAYALENIPLVWLPTNDIYQNSSANQVSYLYNEKIKIHPFVDLRLKPNVIGKNVDGYAKLATTKDEVATWCTEQFKQCLSQFGVIPVASGETLIISGEIIQFHVSDAALYKGTVGIKLKVERPDGKLVWQEMMAGSEKRFGLGSQDENYYKVLSDSFIDAFHNFLDNKTLGAALQNNNPSGSTDDRRPVQAIPR